MTTIIAAATTTTTRVDKSVLAFYNLTMKNMIMGNQECPRYSQAFENNKMNGGAH
jgi:hypothetical protein